MWDIQSTIQMMRALSLSADADELTQVVFNHMRHTASMNRAVVINRLDLAAPRYRVAQYTDWDAQQRRFVESQPNDVREGGLLAQLLYAGELHLIADLSIAASEPAGDLLRGQKALLAFPLFDKGHATGTIILLSAEPLDCSPSELCGLAMMGGLFDRAMQTHSLVRQLEATCQTLDRELAAAADVQRWLLPARLPVLPGVSIAASYRTAKQSGGDYYDVMELPDGRLGFLIADVSGKGAPAAVLMAVARTIVHLRQGRWSNPASLLHDLNDNLCNLDLLGRGAFVTAFCAVLDPESGSLVYSSAGHNPPRLVRARLTQVLGLDEARSLPLGMDAGTQYSEATLSLSPLDTIVLYTDGIVEARSAQGELFGTERLDQALQGLAAALCVQETVQAVVHAVEVFSGATMLSDDQTLVAVTMDGNE